MEDRIEGVQARLELVTEGEVLIVLGLIVVLVITVLIVIVGGSAGWGWRRRGGLGGNSGSCTGRNGSGGHGGTRGERWNSRAAANANDLRVIGHQYPRFVGK